MRTSGFLAAAFVGSLGLAPAVAQQGETAAVPGTEDGARALSESLAAYVGRPAIDKGIVKVAADPSGYRIGFDAASLAPLIEGAGATFSADPFSIVVSPRPDETWSVAMNTPLRFDFALALEGQATSAHYDYGTIDFTGVFSPELGAFLSSTGTTSGGTMTSKDAMSETVGRFGLGRYDVSGERVGNGVVDVKTVQSVEAFHQTMTYTLDPSAGDQRTEVAFGAGALTLDASSRAMKSRALMDLWAFAVANADEAKIKADAPELKRRLGAVLPLWDDFETVSAFRDFVVTTPVGTFRMDEISQSLGGDGVEAAGRYRYGFSYKGLAIDAPDLPAWSAPLIPREMALAFTVADLDLDTPARLFIDDLDVARAEPVSAEVGERIASHFSDKPPRVTLEPTRLVAEDYEVALSGEATFGGAAPQVSLMIEAKGLDMAIKTLQDAGASDQRAFQIVGPLSIASGFAKRLPDGRAQWLIEASGNGSVKINGAEIKGPDAPPPAPGSAPTDDNALPRL